MSLESGQIIELVQAARWWLVSVSVTESFGRCAKRFPPLDNRISIFSRAFMQMLQVTLSHIQILLVYPEAHLGPLCLLS